MTTDTMLSRSGKTHPGGKLTCRIDIPCTEELEAAVITLAGMHGIPKAEYARGLLERVVLGELPMMRRIVGLGPSMQLDEVGRNQG